MTLFTSSARQMSWFRGRVIRSGSDGGIKGDEQAVGVIIRGSGFGKIGIFFDEGFEAAIERLGGFRREIEGFTGDQEGAIEGFVVPFAGRDIENIGFGALLNVFTGIIEQAGEHDIEAFFTGLGGQGEKLTVNAVVEGGGLILFFDNARDDAGIDNTDERALLQLFDVVVEFGGGKVEDGGDLLDCARGLSAKFDYLKAERIGQYF